MRTLHATVFYTLTCITMLSLSMATSFASQIYLEDGDPSKPVLNNPNMPTIAQHQWPRIMMAETRSLGGNLEQYSKYQVIATQAGVINKVASLQQTYPDLMYFRMFNPFEFHGYNDEDGGLICPQGNGIPFNSTSATTGNCSVFAGHWLYQAGGYTTAYLNKTSTSIAVEDASIYVTGEYVVIYNSPAGSFNNAEHLKVVGRSVSNNTLTVQRAYKSNAENHPNGSIVAQHVPGQSQSNDPRNWAYNLSAMSARDAANKRLVDYLPGWLANNYKKSQIGEQADITVSGLLFDSDGAFLSANKKADANNDLVTDDGLSSTGTNWYEQGLDEFYAGVRVLFPDHIISGGTRDARGFADLNGLQMEGFPTYSDFHNATPDYRKLGSLLAKYSYQSRHRATAPAHTHILTKTPTKLYPLGASPTPANNKPFRFALGMTLLEDGYFVSINSITYPDIWFDEYAVDVNPGSSTYGDAITSNQSDESQIRAHTGWLGMPVSLRKRIYSDTQFAPNQSLLQNGSFESAGDLSAWQGKELTISHNTESSNVQDGTGSLHASVHNSYQPLLYLASIKGPSVPVTAGTQYTLAFSAKASKVREITAAAGGHSERFLLGTDWQRIVMTFTAESDVTAAVKFNVGREESEVWIDSVHLFEGNANVFRRDFDHGIVVVNATPSQKTISLNGTFQRIKGTQDSINNGASITSVTLPAYDSALLVRPDGTSVTDTEKPAFIISAPTKTSPVPIGDTTIVVEDNVAILASAVELRAVSTADVTNFNCSQTNATRVDCSLTINSSGNLYLQATDAQGNRRYKNVSGYQINSQPDVEAPVFTISAPTSASSVPINDTTIVVEDNVAILASAVELRSISTADVTNFNCLQTSTTRVDCSLTINSSGDLRLQATDAQGNRRFKNVSGYQISSQPDTEAPVFTISAPTKTNPVPISNVTIVVVDNVAILASAVELRSISTANVTNFNCLQTSTTRVDCSLIINSSGDLRFRATDSVGNKSYKNSNGYLIQSATNMLVPIREHP